MAVNSQVNPDAMNRCLNSLDNDQLVEQWAEQDQIAREAEALRSRLAYELQRRFEEAGQTAMAHDDYDITIQFPRQEYDQPVLMGLKELVEPSVWDTAYTRARERIVVDKEKLDMRVVKTWVKFGDAVREHIERAKLPMRGTLRIRAKA